MVLILFTIFYQKPNLLTKMYGIKVSKSGYDVRTTGDRNLIYSSQYSNLKVYTILNKTLTVNASLTPTSTTVNNPLSYSPIYFPYIESTTVAPGYWRPAVSGGTPEFPPDMEMVYVGADFDNANNRFNLTVTQNSSSTRTYTFRIVIFVDKFTGTSADLGSTETYGMKVSKEGKDVVDDLDTDMSVSSQYPSLTVNRASSLYIAGNPDPNYYGYGSYTHNLGYVPIFMSWVTEDDTNFYQQPMSVSFGGHSLHSEVYADSTKIYFNGYYSTNHYLLFDQVLK